jgi:TonB family protein
VFEQSFTAGQPVRQGWSFAGSVVLQLACLGGMILLPLLNTYEIDLGAWGLRAIYLTPPPPPAPPPPRAAPAPRAAPQRYETEFRAPSVIPDQVAILNDIGSPVSPLAAMPAPSGPLGGTGDSSAAGVFGMFPTPGQHLALPPPIRIGGNIQDARILHKPPPVYPPEAVEQYVSGKVQLEAIISIDGRVRDLKLISGHPLLAPAAMDAVLQWRYRPTRLNGTVVEVVTIIAVNFNLTIIDEKELKRRRRQERRERNAQ